MKLFSPITLALPLSGLRKILLSFVLILLAYSMSFGQNINKVEYFFDTDPGFGNGTSVPVTPTPDLTNLSFNINIVTLPQGFHQLYIRAKDDSGRWSHTNARSLYKYIPIAAAPNISKMEYFFDTDPGFGNGTAVPFTNNSVADSLGFSVDITALSSGFHFFYVRAKDTHGKWSLTDFRSFYKVLATPSAVDVVAAEYFFDTDPGFGSGIAVPVNAGADVDPINFTVDISSLSEGFHNVLVRVKDAANRWSVTHMRSFVKASIVDTGHIVVAAEYFFDTDPGFGLGVSVPLTPSDDITNLPVTIDITAMSEGFHQILFRVKDNEGNWSLNHVRSFYKVVTEVSLPVITAVEYFFDTDPGFGNATAVAITPGVNKILNFNVSIFALSRGFHQLFVRVKDSLNNWSLTAMRTFYKELPPAELSKIKRLEYFFDTDPGFGLATPVALPADTNNLELAWDIDINSLSQGFHSLHVRAKNATGKWSLTSFKPFFKQLLYDTLPKITKVEYFYDTDPGIGNGINVPLTPTQNLTFLSWVLNLNNVAFGQHQLFVRAKDEYGHWSLRTHDTIFYYLDSLPTAALSGPMGVCVYDTATFEINLTGTPPWTVILNDGFQVDTIHNIMTTPHTYSIVPQLTGTKTAKILKVMDVYYTGLYTGIPIDYEVNPFPEAITAIQGPVNICQGSQGVTFWIYNVGNANTYQWTVPAGATIVSQGYYWWYGGNWITVNFAANAQSGNVTVRGLNGCGYGPTTSLAINLRDLPEVEIGPDVFVDYNDTVYLSATVTTGTAPYSYSWSPWWLFNNNGIADPIAMPTSNTAIAVSISDVYGCSATDQSMIYVGPPAGTTITGKVKYNNANAWGIPNTTVYLKQGATTISQTAADASGNYTIAGVPAGYYTITAGSTYTWSGVNAIDALVVMKHFAGITFLSGLRLGGADVNATGNINAVDALRCAQRFAGVVSSFNAGDWVFDAPYFYANVVGNLSIDIQGLCVGDVDASYNPSSKLQPTIEMKQSGMLEAPAMGTIDIPVSVSSDIQTAAISLVLHIPSGYVVEDVKMNKGKKDELVFNRVGNDLRIAWFSVEPIDIKADEVLMYIKVTYRNLPTENWTVAEESNIADGNGTMRSLTGLSVPKLVVGNTEFGLGENYPNPFSQTTTIPFALPADAKVRLSILNLLGEEIMVLADQEMKAGSHVFSMDGSALSAGIYQYRLVAETANMHYEQTHKLAVAR